MQTYIGTKIVRGRKMKLGEYNVYRGWQIPKDENPEREGYLVRYEDDYESWSPKEAFERAYMLLHRSDKITQQDVDDFIVDVRTEQMGDKTTFVMATLRNGFILCDTSSCVDPANFNMDIGKDICMEHIKNQVWYLLGFLLQSGKGKD